MHGKEIAHIIRKKREAKRPQSMDTPIIPQSPPTPAPSQLEQDFRAAWACFLELHGPRQMWRIENLIDRGLSWRMLGLRNPKRATIQDSVFTDIVRYAKSKAKKGKDRYDIVPVWFGADMGPRQKHDKVKTHCVIKDMPTMQARYDWLRQMNAALSAALPALLDYYEEQLGKMRTLPSEIPQDAHVRTWVQSQSDQYMRTRQPHFRTDLESQAGFGSAVPKGPGGHKTQVTHFKGWEHHPNQGLPDRPRKTEKK